MTTPIILNDLTAQRSRINRASTRLAGVPEWYWRDSADYQRKLQGFVCAAEYSNTINGDYQSAEGCLENLNEELTAIEDKIADAASDVETYGEG